MNNINQRLKRLTETDFCEAEAAEKYQKELIQLADEAANIKTAKKQSKLFKALSDEKRLQIIKLLRAKEKMCICELMVCLDMTQPNLSHHIQILENIGIVNRKKMGKWVYCSLANRRIVEKLTQLNLL